MGSGKHFYTIDPHEATVAIENGRILEGIACFVLPIVPDPQPPVVPLYRAYKADIDDHLYTTNEVEANQTTGYHFEGIACQVYDPFQPKPDEASPLYRALNPQTGEHFYTTDQNEYNTVLQNGFQRDGVGPDKDLSCYVYDLNQKPVPQGALPFYREFTP